MKVGSEIGAEDGSLEGKNVGEIVAVVPYE